MGTMVADFHVIMDIRNIMENVTEMIQILLLLILKVFILQQISQKQIFKQLGLII